MHRGRKASQWWRTHVVNGSLPSSPLVAVGRPQTLGGTVWASAIRPANTGVGVFQRQLYSRLVSSGFAVEAQPEPSQRVMRAVLSFGQVVRPPHVAALVCTTPAPLVLRVPVVAFVYDLRWRRTRAWPLRMYNYLDLRRTVARADHVFAISERTRDELVELFPRVGGKCEILRLGPGMIRDSDYVDGDAGTVLLAGLAPYKRNELVAAAFALGCPGWAERFLCVGISDAAFQILVDKFGLAACERYNCVDDILMRKIFRRASVYVSASMEEGFGLPWVEALTAGCQVVAVRQPLTIEVLGDAAVLIDDGDVQSIADQLRHPTWISEEKRRTRAAIFSWDEVAEKVITACNGLSP